MNAASGGTGKRILLKMLVVMIAGSSLTVTAISFAHKRGSDAAAVMDTLTFHINAQRTGWNSMESVLTPANVSGPYGIPAGTILWGKSLGQPTDFGLDGGVAMGILGTPVIDPNAAPPTLYVAADATNDSGRAWKVFALDIGSGAILPGWPLVIN